MQDLAGKTASTTGGATSIGLGMATAFSTTAFSTIGMQVVIGDDEDFGTFFVSRRP